jgi:fructose/tagatose bisphosphate aldolase
MPLVTDPAEVESIYVEARERGVCLANFCSSNSYTTQAILRAAWECGCEHGVARVPIIVSATANYLIEGQLVSYTPLHNARIGARALIAEVETLLGEGSPYSALRIMLHLDHGQPNADRELITEILDKYATVMYNASSLPFEENIRRTAEFVERYQHFVQIEGAVTEIVQAESQAQRDELTTPEEAERFWRETGVSLLMPNLGTEHRATAPVARYDPQAARAISARVGRRLVLHAASSVPDAALRTLAEDGIIKVNLWTVFERMGGQAVARFILKQLGNILPTDELVLLHAEGWLGERYLSDEYRNAVCGVAIGPKLSGLREEHRRDAWQDAVVARMKVYLNAFHYANFASGG